MLDVAGYINEAHRDVEHLNVINNLQDTIVEWEHEPEMRWVISRLIAAFLGHLLTRILDYPTTEN